MRIREGRRGKQEARIGATSLSPGGFVVEPSGTAKKRQEGVKKVQYQAFEPGRERGSKGTDLRRRTGRNYHVLPRPHIRENMSRPEGRGGIKDKQPFTATWWQ